MSQKFKIAELIPHKDNDFFFDDIQGESWQEFIDSVKTSGVIEPIVITQDKVIVSGHQRVRACKALGIEEIDAEVRIFDSEDEILKCLIETNIRQRGIGNTNPVKFGRCIKELERIYGVRDGSEGKRSLDQNNSGLKTQEDLASQLGISTDTLRNYKQLADAIPEIQTLVETGIVTPTTARAIVKKLPKFQQKELAEQFAEKREKVTGKEAEKEIARLNARVEELVNSKSQREKFEKDRADRLQEENNSLKEQVSNAKVEFIEIYPDDYESLKARAEELEQIEPEKVEVYPEDYEELKVIKQQMEVNAKIEIADFVKKYSDYVDVRKILQGIIETI